MEVDINERKIIDGCVAGNQAMQKALFEKYSKILMGVSVRYFKNSDDAEDAVQEAFIKIFAKIGTFKRDVPIIFWMRKIVINTALNKIRADKKFVSEDAPKYSESPYKDNGAISNMNANDLLKVIQELPDGFRAVFNLHAIDGYSHAEISEMLGISEGTSKSQYSRAKSHLRDILTKKADLEPEMA